MSTKSFTTNFSFSDKASTLLAKAINKSKPLSNDSFPTVHVLSLNELKSKLIKKSRA